MVDEFERAVSDRWVGAQVTRMHAERFRVEEVRDIKTLLRRRSKVTPGQITEVVADIQRAGGGRVLLGGGWATYLHTYPFNLREPSADLDFFARNEDTMISLRRTYDFKFVHEWGAWTGLVEVQGRKTIRVDINHVDMIPPSIEIYPPTEVAKTQCPILVVRPIRILAGKLARTWDQESARPTDVLDVSSYLLESVKNPDTLTEFLEMIRLNERAREAFKLLGLPNSLTGLADDHKISQVWSVLRKFPSFC